MFQPVIKWSGSKRSQCNNIIKYFPKTIDNYIEPFCGGASVMRCLLENIESNNIVVKDKIICADLNKDLISLFNYIKYSPHLVSEHYEKLWKELNETGKNIVEKREYFESIRERLNKIHNPLDFMFIMRTTTNGMPRYNSNGEFNNSFHLTRNGIEPHKLDKIINEWSTLLYKHDVKFIFNDYISLLSNINIYNENNLIYLDPPYGQSKHKMYFGTFNNIKMFDFLKNVKSKYILSYDGTVSNNDNELIENNIQNVPNELYKRHILLESGKSSFRRIVSKGEKDNMIKESIYLNY